MGSCVISVYFSWNPEKQKTFHLFVIRIPVKCVITVTCGNQESANTEIFSWKARVSECRRSETCFCIRHLRSAVESYSAQGWVGLLCPISNFIRSLADPPYLFSSIIVLGPFSVLLKQFCRCTYCLLVKLEVSFHGLNYCTTSWQGYILNTSLNVFHTISFLNPL